MSRRIHKGYRKFLLPGFNRHFCLLGKNGNTTGPFHLVSIQKGVSVVHSAQASNISGEV